MWQAGRYLLKSVRFGQQLSRLVVVLLEVDGVNGNLGWRERIGTGVTRHGSHGDLTILLSASYQWGEFVGHGDCRCCIVAVRCFLPRRCFRNIFQYFWTQFLQHFRTQFLHGNWIRKGLVPLGVHGELPGHAIAAENLKVFDGNDTVASNIRTSMNLLRQYFVVIFH